jgi:hypothetical protein
MDLRRLPSKGGHVVEGSPRLAGLPPIRVYGEPTPGFGPGHEATQPATICPDQRRVRKNSRMSAASATGSSAAAKWPPAGITVQRRMS